MSKNTFLPEDLSGNMVSQNNKRMLAYNQYSAKVYIQASALQKCAKHLPPTFGGMIAMQSGRCPNMSKNNSFTIWSFTMYHSLRKIYHFVKFISIFRQGVNFSTSKQNIGWPYTPFRWCTRSVAFSLLDLNRRHLHKHGTCCLFLKNVEFTLLFLKFCIFFCICAFFFVILRPKWKK